MKFTGGLVSMGVGASHVSLRIKHWTETLEDTVLLYTVMIS